MGCSSASPGDVTCKEDEERQGAEKWGYGLLEAVGTGGLAGRNPCGEEGRTSSLISS